ncbi:glycoside hydrolase family 44 protein [Dokdonella sp.]|uniref:glycoside hydrolase family 44 protein n=1 Tax=Dokdonella sp. TaxID=2291710 RepID=UPI0031C34900|nr:glycoside hydrolase family 44 protein [Dokdonella sp.]
MSAGGRVSLNLVLCAWLSLLCGPAVATGAVQVSVDRDAQVRPFSPLIFGVNFGDAARNAEMGYPLQRWGGNATTRYNWRVDVHNTAQDWFFENIPGAADRSQVPPAGNAVDALVGAARAHDAQVIVTLPTIGWVPRADSPQLHPYFAGYSVARYGPQQATDPWDPDAGNGVRVDGSPITGNDPRDTSSEASPAFFSGWIAHLGATFGDAASGGVRYYALDNEVMLWNSTHRDVHPQPATFGETRDKALAYGAMVKQADPTARVTGPVTWGYCDLFGSAADNCVDGSDRAAHGGLPFVAWYLQQVCANPLPGGARAVDVLDLHWYPQGQGIALSDDDSSATAARRLRSLKELYDADWVSESWIADLGDGDANHYARPNLIPRVRAWIDAYCPGTQLAITEYNWGNDNTASGAVAQAELFGILAREGVDLAARWVAPAAGSRVERAFSLLLDYDGAGTRVSGASVHAASADPDRVGAYAFRDAARTLLLLTNKTGATQDVAVDFAAVPGSRWTLYGFDAAQPVHAIAAGDLSGSTLLLAGLPAMSANLLVVGGADSDLVFRDGFE